MASHYSMFKSLGIIILVEGIIKRDGGYKRKTNFELVMSV